MQSVQILPTIKGRQALEKNRWVPLAIEKIRCGGIHRAFRRELLSVSKKMFFGVGGVVFTIESNKDTRLVNRAIKQGWNVDKAAVKQALMGCLEDPDLKIKACKILLECDALDLKRDKLEAKTEAVETSYRARLLKLARTIPEDQLRLAAKISGIQVPDGPLFPEA